MAAPKKTKPKKIPDTVAKSAQWTLRFKHAQPREWWGLKWYTKPRLVVRPRIDFLLTALLVHKTLVPSFTIKAHKVKSVGWARAGRRDGQAVPGQLILRVPVPARRLRRVPPGFDPRRHEWTTGPLDMFRANKLRRILAAGQKEAGWKIKNGVAA